MSYFFFFFSDDLGPKEPRHSDNIFAKKRYTSIVVHAPRKTCWWYSYVALHVLRFFPRRFGYDCIHSSTRWSLFLSTGIYEGLGEEGSEGDPKYFVPRCVSPWAQLKQQKTFVSWLTDFKSPSLGYWPVELQYTAVVVLVLRGGCCGSSCCFVPGCLGGQ